MINSNSGTVLEVIGNENMAKIVMLSKKHFYHFRRSFCTRKWFSLGVLHDTYLYQIFKWFNLGFFHDTYLYQIFKWFNLGFLHDTFLYQIFKWFNLGFLHDTFLY
jgi:hypothetical protein